MLSCSSSWAALEWAAYDFVTLDLRPYFEILTVAGGFGFSKISGVAARLGFDFMRFTALDGLPETSPSARSFLTVQDDEPVSEPLVSAQSSSST